MDDNTADIPSKVIHAITTQTMIIHRQGGFNRFLWVMLIIVGGCLATTGYVGFVSVGIAVVIFLMGEAINWFVSLKDPNEKDLRWYRFELILLLFISLELIVAALLGPNIWPMFR